MGPGQHHRMARHRAFMNMGVPAEYRGRTNPLETTPEVVSEGGLLYQTQCALCHGTQGYGDGVAGNSLSPSPALLAHLIQTPMAIDAYLFWSIAEGGAAFGSAMPAFKDGLTEEEIWKIITYLRAGLPALEQSDQQSD